MRTRIEALLASAVSRGQRHQDRPTVPDHEPPAFVLGSIHRLVRCVDQVASIARRDGAGGPDADRHHDLVPAGMHGSGQGGSDPPDDRLQLLVDDLFDSSQVFTDGNELVAGHPRQRVAHPQHRRRPARHLGENDVTRGVTQRVVDLLEAIYVDQQHGQRRLVSRSGFRGVLYPVEEQCPIR